MVIDWTVIAGNTAGGVNGGARNMAIVALAMFEAVNAITGEYEPYLCTVRAPGGASAEAAAVAAGYRVLRTFVTAPATIATLDAGRQASLATIADGQSKVDGIQVGEEAAAAMLALAAGDGSSSAAFFEPSSTAVGVWQPTPSCPVNAATAQRVGTSYQVPRMRPSGNTYGVRLIAPQLAQARGDSLSENARNFALIAMAPPVIHSCR